MRRSRGFVLGLLSFGLRLRCARRARAGGHDHIVGLLREDTALRCRDREVGRTRPFSAGRHRVFGPVSKRSVGDGSHPLVGELSLNRYPEPSDR